MSADPAPLPENRVKEAAAFEITGVDFAGPIFLRGDLEAWICLFTCAVYRVVHLELVTSLSTVTFIEALRRFITRRGRPTIYSDNGTYFVDAEKLFKRIDLERITKIGTSRQITWPFNPRNAPW